MANEENLIPFKKGKSGNPKGRPKKLVSASIEKLEETGELVTRKLVETIYKLLLSQTKSNLTDIQNDENQPVINRIVAEEMLGDRGFEVIEKMMDRANGKPTQVVQSTVKIKESQTDAEIQQDIDDYEKRNK